MNIADLPFLGIYRFPIGFAIEWEYINTEDDEGGRIKKIIIEGAKYDGFDNFYLIEVPLTDSVKTQLDNFRWLEIGYNQIVTEYDERLLMLVRLATNNASDVKVLYTHKAD